jgi:MFS family permease
MPKALELTAQEYFNVLMIFCEPAQLAVVHVILADVCQVVSFLVAELPMALLMRVVPAQFVFGGAILLFGLCASCMAVSGGYAGLMVLRTILGMGEAVLTLGFLYLSLWYRPDELAFRSGEWHSPLLACGTFADLLRLVLLLHTRCRVCEWPHRVWCCQEP